MQLIRKILKQNLQKINATREASCIENLEWLFEFIYWFSDSRRFLKVTFSCSFDLLLDFWISKSFA